MSERTDTERLDLLQAMTQGYGNGWILRLSLGGRGWRLHETSRPEAKQDIREAIDEGFEKSLDMLMDAGLNAAIDAEEGEG